MTASVLAAGNTRMMHYLLLPSHYHAVVVARSALRYTVHDEPKKN